LGGMKCMKNRGRRNIERKDQEAKKEVIKNK
jgi:hypothetical protein